jgi:hypothetical protein
MSEFFSRRTSFYLGLSADISTPLIMVEEPPLLASSPPLGCVCLVISPRLWF